MKLRILLVMALLCLLMSVPAIAAANENRVDPEIYPFAELTEGLTGTGYTVIKGIEIETFPVKIVSLMEKGGFNGGPMILVKGWGPLLDETGGFAGGFSGSPVYVKGKLIGAISSAWYFADGSIAGVTPIEQMLKVLDNPVLEESHSLLALNTPVVENGISYDKAMFGFNPEPPADLPEDALYLAACRTPFQLSGLNGPAFDWFKEEMEKTWPWMEVVQGVGIGGSGEFYPRPEKIEPGAAVGLRIVGGDVDLSGTGTLTWIGPNGRFLAFGHPAMGMGEINGWPLTSSHILHTMSSIQRSFKMGVALDDIGCVYQDRSTAIAGRLGDTPPLVPFTITVHDRDRDYQETFELQVVDQQEIVAAAGLAGAMQALTQFIDRSGPATIDVSTRIEADGIAEPLVLDNRIFTGSVGPYSMIDYLSAMSLLMNNSYREIHINKVQINLSLERERKTLRIEKAEFPKAGSDDPFDGIDEILDELGDETPEGEKSSEDGWTEEKKDTGAQETPDEGEIIEPPKFESETLINGGKSRRFKPGETITISVTLRPYRAAKMEQEFTLTIPEEFPIGRTRLVVRGGGYSVPIPQQQNSAMQMGMTQPHYPDNFDEVIEDFLERDRNDELVLELFKPNFQFPNQVDEEYADEDEEEDEEAKKPSYTEKFQQDQVVTGYYQLGLNIVAKEDEKKDEPKEQPKKDEPKEQPKKKEKKKRNADPWWMED